MTCRNQWQYYTVATTVSVPDDTVRALAGFWDLNSRLGDGEQLMTTFVGKPSEQPGRVIAGLRGELDVARNDG